MFDSILQRDPRIDGHKTLLLALSVLLHGGVVALLLFLTLFHVEELPEPQVMVTFFAAPAPPPPPPPPPPPKRAISRPRPRVVVPKPDEVQPPDNPPEVAPAPVETPASGDEAGESGGQEGGVAGGVAGGVVGGLPTAAKAAPARKHPIFVKRAVVEKLKLSGEMPEYLPAARMARVKGVVIVKTCLKTDGTVDRVRTKILKGIPVMDAEVLAKVRAWRYKPYLVDGVATAVCFPVRFILRLQ